MHGADRTPCVRHTLAALALLAAAAVAAGCGSSSSGPSITVGAARTYRLAAFEPARAVKPRRPVAIAFTIRQPDGSPLTDYRRGGGPHTRVHLILVRNDLGTIIHRHPQITADGRIREPIVFPAAGRYRLVIDAYPNTNGPQRNFQLFKTITVTGAHSAEALPSFAPTQTVDGYRFTMHGRPRLEAIRPASLTISVTAPSGKPAPFAPLYGALAHAIFFRQGTLDYFHTHVCAPGASGCASVLGGARVTGSSAAPGKLTVGVLLPVPGTWRLFVQCMSGGRVLTAPFTLDVR